MIALSIALVVIAAMALYAWTNWVAIKHPKANSPEAEFNDLKNRVGKLELKLAIKPEVPLQPGVAASIFTRLR